MPNRLFRRLALLVLAAALALSGCQRDATPAPVRGGDSPAEAMRELLGTLRRNDVAGFWQQALPPPDYAVLQASWLQRRARMTLSGEDRDRFNQTLRRFTAPGAAAALDAQWQPRLAHARQQYGDQLPLLIGIGQSLFGQTLAGQRVLDPEQQAQVRTLLAALAPWAQRAPWFDPARAQRLAGITVDNARALHLRRADQVLALDFDAATRKASVLLAGLKHALTLYGLPVDAVLDSARVAPVDVQGDRASVRADYTLLGQSRTAIVQMRRIEGRWYCQGLIEAVRRFNASTTTAAGAAPPRPQSPDRVPVH